MIILSLCDRTGILADAFRRRGHEVHQVDLAHGMDVLTWAPPAVYDGVAAFPPCTVFSCCGAFRWPTTPDADFFLGVAIATRCWEIAIAARRWWFIENPRGRLSSILGNHVYTFHPWHFGDPQTKRTQLWGRFTPPARAPTIPTEHLIPGNRRGGAPLFNATMPTATVGRARDPRRSATSPGFAEAFAAANS